MFQICFYQVYHVVDMYTPKVGILFLIPDLKVLMLKVNVFGRLRREVNELPIRSPPPLRISYRQMQRRGRVCEME